MGEREAGMQPIVLRDEESDCESCLESPWVSVRLSAPEIHQENMGYAYVNYLITVVNSENQKQLVRRRYSEFEELDHKLREQYGGEVTICGFPPKTSVFKNTLDRQFVEKRRKALELWLAGVVLNPVIGRGSEVGQFLGAGT